MAGLPYWFPNKRYGMHRSAVNIQINDNHCGKKTVGGKQLWLMAATNLHNTFSSYSISTNHQRMLLVLRGKTRLIMPCHFIRVPMQLKSRQVDFGIELTRQSYETCMWDVDLWHSHIMSNLVDTWSQLRMAYWVNQKLWTTRFSIMIN